MPYNTDSLGDYTELIGGTHVFSYNKIVAMGVLINPAVDYADPAVWTAYGEAPGTLAADVKVIQKVIGTYDGGSQTTDKGYGTKLQVVTDNTHTIDARCEYNKVNIAFMQALSNSENVGIVFFTGNMEEMHVVTGVDVSFTAKMPVTDEINKPREFTFQAVWSKIGLPPVVAHTADLAALFK